MRIVALALTLVLLAACGGGDEVVSTDDPRPSTTPAGPTGPAPDQRYTATATVLESPEHGPQLCLGGVLTSYPPQCGGPDVIGWDWDEAPGHESANGITWGDYTVIGTWDGSALTLTEPPRAPEPASGPVDDDRFASPCPEPDGGWQVVDPATATQEAMEAAMAHARRQPDVGGIWVDQIAPASADPEVDEERMADPTRLVLNVTFTGDLARHEADLRERWGGPLCVSEAAAALADLEVIRQEVQDELAGRFLYSNVDEVTGRVEIGVPVDDGLQARFDERYGEGVVRVDPQLRPVAD